MDENICAKGILLIFFFSRIIFLNVFWWHWIVARRSLEDEGMSNLPNIEDKRDKVQMLQEINETDVQTNEHEDLQKDVEVLRLSLHQKKKTIPDLMDKNMNINMKMRVSTDLYKQLPSEVQDSKESPQSLLRREMNLRQKTLFPCQGDKSGLKYDPTLVQSLFIHTVLTALQKVKSDLLPYLMQSNTPDELLLEIINIAFVNEKETEQKEACCPLTRN